MGPMRMSSVIPVQPLTLKWASYPHLLIAWGLSCAHKWLLWTLNTPLHLKKCFICVLRRLCKTSSFALCLFYSSSQNRIHTRWETNMHSASSGMGAIDRCEVFQGLSVGIVPILMWCCLVFRHDSRSTAKNYGIAMGWCLYSPWVTHIHVCHRC